MAFEDGMKALSKTLEISGCVLGLCVLVFGVTQLDSWIVGLVGAIIAYILLWTPAWIIKKFVQ